MASCAPPRRGHVWATWLGETQGCSCCSSDSSQRPFLSACDAVYFEAGNPLIFSYRCTRKKRSFQTKGIRYICGHSMFSLSVVGSRSSLIDLPYQVPHLIHHAY